MSSETRCEGLRVLLVGPYPPPFGGIASHFTMLIPGLLARGAESVSVLSFTDKDDKDEEKQGASIYRRNITNHVKALMNPLNWRYLFAARRALSGTSFGIKKVINAAVQCYLADQIASKDKAQVVSFYQVDLSLGLVPYAYVSKGQTPILLTVFGEVFDNPEFFSGNERFIDEMLTIPAAVLASSKHCANSFKPLGVSREVEAVYYGVELERFENVTGAAGVRADMKMSDNDVLVTYMGRFSKEMGVGRAMDITPGIVSQYDNVKLLFVGAKGPLADRAAELAASHPDRVFVRHDIPFDLQPDIYAATDVLLAPSASQHACMGMSIKEAMASSKCVVGTISGGVPEAIVDGETGYLVETDDEGQANKALFKDAICKLIENEGDRVRMGENGRKRAEAMFSTDVTIDRVTTIMKQALGRR